MSRYYYFRASQPKIVKGGIKSRNKRGSFVNKWWGKKCIKIIEDLNIGDRLTDGRSYARKGQVLTLEIKEGEAIAQVQGSRVDAYEVLIKLNTFTKKQWKKIISIMAERPIYSAQLLSGMMPEKIEEPFHKAGVSFFPEHQNEFISTCTCPDWSKPCKHVVAVYYLIAEAFEQDPYLLFLLRGMNREDLLMELEKHGLSSNSIGDNETEDIELEMQLLPDNPAKFWGHDGDYELTGIGFAIPDEHAQLPERLGPIPFWRGEHSFEKVMDSAYFDASDFTLSFMEKLVTEEE